MKKSLLTAMAIATLGVAYAAQPYKAIKPEMMSGLQPATVNHQKADFTKMYHPLTLQTSRAALKAAALKDAKVGALTASAPSAGAATYVRPSGLYYVGYGVAEGTYYYAPPMVGPAFAEHTWMNISGQATKSWSYDVGGLESSGGDTYTSTDKDLTFAYDRYTLSNLPTLTTADDLTWRTYGLNGTGEVVESFVNTFGIPDPNLGNEIFGVSCVPMFGFTHLGGGKEGEYLLGKNETVLGVTGFGMLMTKPAVPYLLESVFGLAQNLKIAGNGELRMNVYEVDDEGSLGEVIAIGIATSKDVQNVAQFSDGSVLNFVDFKFYQEDELGGTQQVVLHPETALYFEIADYKENADVQFDAFFANWPFIDEQQTRTAVAPENIGYVSFVGEGGKKALASINDLYEEGGLPYNSPCLFVNGQFHNIAFDKTTVNIPVSGGQVSSNMSTIWNLTAMEGLISVLNDIPDWLSILLGKSDMENGLQEIGFEAQALPGDMEGRSAEIEFSTYFGGLAKVTVVQGTSSVDGVEMGASKVTVEGGNFVVSSVDANAVEIYNLAGQKVAEAAFEGEAVVSGAGLAGGVYIVKFNDNTVVKVVK